MKRLNNWVLNTKIKGFGSLVFIYLIFAYLAFPVWFKFNEDFDPAFKLAITDGLYNHLIFGIQNSCGTYGALGIFTNRLPTSGLFPYVFLFDVGICLAIILLITRNTRSEFTPISLLTSLFCFYNISFQYDNYIVFLPLIQLYILSQPNYKNQPALGFLNILIAVLAFYIKTSFGMFMIPIALLANLLLCKVNAIKIVLWFGFAISILFGLSFYTNTDLYGTVVETFSHFSGYNSVMVLYPENLKAEIKSSLIIVIQVGLSAYGTYLFFVSKSRVEKSIIFIALFYIFLLFKSSIVRADGLHLDYYIGFIALFVMQIEPLRINRPILQPISFCLILLSFIFIGARQIGQNNTKILRFYPYLLSFFQTEKEIKSTAIRKFPLVSRSFKKIIGSQNVTCIPFNYSVVGLDASLNYINIPTVQSMYCYNYFLDSLNANYYREQKADFILEHSQSTDPLQALALENTSFLTRKQYYQPVAFDNDYLLLGKRKLPLLISFKSLNLNAPVQSSQLVLNFEPSKTYRITFKYQSGLVKKLTSAIYKYPNVPITIEYKDTSITKPVGYSILERGILISTINHTIKELTENYLVHDLACNNYIKRIKFNFEGLDLYDISYSLEEISFKNSK